MNFRKACQQMSNALGFLEESIITRGMIGNWENLTLDLMKNYFWATHEKTKRTYTC